GNAKGEISVRSLDGKEINSWVQEKGAEVCLLAFSADGTRLEARTRHPDTWDSTICLWELAKGRRGFEHKLPFGAHAAYSANHKAVACTSLRNAVSVRDVALNKATKTHVWAPDENVESLAYAQNGKLLVIVNKTDEKGGKSRIWDGGDTAEGREL